MRAEAQLSKRVKLKIDGEKRRGTITHVTVDVQAVDVTYGGTEGSDPDVYRTFAPGRKVTTITIVLDE